MQSLVCESGNFDPVFSSCEKLFLLRRPLLYVVTQTRENVKYGLDCKFGYEQGWGKPQRPRHINSWILERHYKGST